MAPATNREHAPDRDAVRQTTAPAPVGQASVGHASAPAVPAPMDAFDVPLWRALAVFRMAALGYVALTVASNFRQYRYPWLVWTLLLAMAAWTAAATYAYGTTRRRAWPLLGADLLITVVCVVAAPPLVGTAAMTDGVAPVPPSIWMAGPVLSWAIAGGRRMAALAAILVGATDASTHTYINQVTFNGPVLLLLAGIAVGHIARLTVDARRRLQRAVELDAASREREAKSRELAAATRERERLARGIHDSVLQVLALVQRRGAEIGGPAAELGRLAGEQEAALRALVAGDAGPDPAVESGAGPRGAGPRGAGPRGAGVSGAVPDGTGGDADLRAELGRYAAARVSLAAPADPVLLPVDVVAAVGAAVLAALDNVRRHCGDTARAWLLVEDEPSCVTVTVRDDGPGIPPGRLEQAEAAGRLGVAQSIRGRIRDAGGTVAITTGAAEGTEIELRLPRPRADQVTRRADQAIRPAPGALD